MCIYKCYFLLILDIKKVKINDYLLYGILMFIKM